jgi:hypothetical protein
MKRLEIIANNTIREDLLEALQQSGLPTGHSWIPGVSGEGTSGPREGNVIWPDSNVLLIVYLEDSDTERVRNALGEVKKRFPGEGIRCWTTPAERML